MKRGLPASFLRGFKPGCRTRSAAVIWGMMVGEEAKTKIPIYQNYTERGFDPQKHMLQSYGTGWQSSELSGAGAPVLRSPRRADARLGSPDEYRGHLRGRRPALRLRLRGLCLRHRILRRAPRRRIRRPWKNCRKFPKEDTEKEKKRLYAPLFVKPEEGVTWKGTESGHFKGHAEPTAAA